MLAKARTQHRPRIGEQTGLDNVEFRLGEIEHLPVADNSVDAIISNCVINLSPDKPQVWREMARVLKPGGRVAVSDMALLKPLPAEVLKMVEALVGCVAGAVLVSDTERMAREAGLTDILLKSKPGLRGGDDGLEGSALSGRSSSICRREPKPADYITSLEVQAREARALLRAMIAVQEANAAMSMAFVNDQSSAPKRLAFFERYLTRLGVPVHGRSAWRSARRCRR